MKLKIISIVLLLAINNLFGKGIDGIQVFTEYYPPYNMMVDGKISGTSVEILDAMIKEMKSEGSLQDVRMTSWARGYIIAQKKKNAMIFSTARIKEREKLFKWVGPVGEVEISIIALKIKKIKIKKISDLNQYRVGAVEKEVGEILMLSRGVKKDVMEYVKSSNAIDEYFNKMQNNTIDVFSYDADGAFLHGKDKGLDMGKYEVVYVLKKARLYFAFNKNTDDSIVKKWQQALDKIKSNGIYAKIRK